MPASIKPNTDYFLTAIALVFFAILTYTIFGWISDFNYTEAQDDCNAYYTVSSDTPAIQANLDRCLDAAQSTRRATNRIGGVVGVILAVLAFGSLLWGIRQLRVAYSRASRFDLLAKLMS